MKDLHKKSVEEHKCINKLEIKNRKRIRELNEMLSLDKINLRPDKKPILMKQNFESYERKKIGLFSWQKDEENQVLSEKKKSNRVTARGCGARAASMEEPCTKAIDSMLGFKQQTGDIQLKKWEKNLQVRPEMLTSQCAYKKEQNVLTDKEEKMIINEIRRRQQFYNKQKMVKLQKKLQPKNEQSYEGDPIIE